ncbi:MAG: hypothetical protein NTY45_06155 [Elusimicrobia bacterium]|nr:hypothetical protein [Elusimicrobiota bacterium]
MKKIFIGILLVITAHIRIASGKDVPPQSLETSKQRIEKVAENGNSFIRFYDKDGERLKEIKLGETDVKARLKKNKVYDSATFGLKVSSTVAKALESSSRDMLITRRETREAMINKGKNCVLITNLRNDFVDYADIKSESEYSEDPIETELISTVYNSDGGELFSLTGLESNVVAMSNTGKFFVTLIDGVEEQIVNSQKELLAKIQYADGGIYFSESDKFLILIEKLPPKSAAVSVFDTKANKLESQKIILEASELKNIKTLEISEKEREIIIRHIGDVKTQEAKVTRIKF